MYETCFYYRACVCIITKIYISTPWTILSWGTKSAPYDVYLILLNIIRIIKHISDIIKFIGLSYRDSLNTTEVIYPSGFMVTLNN